LDTADSGAKTVSTEELMASIRQNLRRRHLAGIEVNPLESARSQLEAAFESSSGYRPLISELINEDEWKVRPAIRFRSHRPVIGEMLVFIKRRIVLPVVYWLYEFCSENFRVQRRVNTGLMVLIETLAQENARLRLDMEKVLGLLEARSDETSATQGSPPQIRE
jgi:hypothetical protein